MKPQRRRIVEFRTRPETEKAGAPKRSVAGKIAAGVGAAGTLAGFYAYTATRPDAKKHRYLMKRAAVSADPARSIRLKSTAAVMKKAATPFTGPMQGPPVPPIIKRSPGRKPVAPAKVKTTKGKAPVVTQTVKPKVKAPAATVQVVRRSLAARVLLTHFQERNRDGTMGVSTNPLTYYRKASRVVPWVNRASEAAGDIGDIASGKKVKDPFYKKPWFKRSVQTAAIGIPLAAMGLARAGERKKLEGGQPSPRTDRSYRARVDRLTHRAADAKKKAMNKLGLSAIAAAHERLVQFAAPVATPTLAQRGLRTKAEVHRALLKKIHAFTSNPKNFKPRVWPHGTRRDFAYADALDKGWDVRDARGRSARVYAPGSRKRDRREKTWGEKTDNIRLVRNIAIGGTIAGGVGAGLLASKAKGNARTLRQQYRKKIVARGGPRMPAKSTGGTVVQAKFSK